jgi:ATP diphosphatase
MPKDAGSELARLVEIMARLRAEGGCPWDREQDLRSLRPYLIEEAYEVLEEMDRVAYGGSWRALCEELGDLLFQIVFHAQLASEIGAFTMADICTAISDKIVSRHPHVFGELRVAGAEQVLQNWAKLKAEEKRRKHGREGSVLDGVPSGAPALQRAERLTEKASRIGFDWPDLEGVRRKLDEELRELDEAIVSSRRDALEHELGDVLFSLANLARFIQTPPEDALRQANARFTRRFQAVEEGLRRKEIPFGLASLDEMDALWREAKEREKAIPPPVHLPRAAVKEIRIPARRMAELRAFWERLAPLLSWEKREHTGNALAFEIGGMQIAFVPDAHAGAAPWAAEILLEAPSRVAVEHMRQELSTRSSAEVGPLEGNGAHVEFRFRDPDGNGWTYAFGE